MTAKKYSIKYDSKYYVWYHEIENRVYIIQFGPEMKELLSHSLYLGEL